MATLCGWLAAIALAVDPAWAGREFEPGTSGYALTALRGGEIERVPLKYLGTFEDFAGPGYDLYLVQLEGPVADHVGVAAGMSGSPVYLDDVLIGALSYRLGALPKDAVAGVTPIDDILDADRARHAAPPADGAAQPIGTPLVAAGLAGEVRGWLAPQLESMGFVMATGGREAAADGAAAPFEPGSPIGVALVRGDITFAATGTVTAVEGDRVFAFGHPFLGGGRTAMPMHTARVVHTLADMLGSQKLAVIGDEAGAIVEDRLTAIVGDRRAHAAMIPVDLTVRGADYGEERFRFEVTDHPSLGPLLVGTVVANALVANAGFSQDATLFVRGTVRPQGLPELPVEIAVAGTGVSGHALAVAGSLASLFNGLWSNPFEPIAIESVSLEIIASREIRQFGVDTLVYDRGAAAPGSKLALGCVLARYRGPREMRQFELTLPAGVDPRLPLMLAVGSPERVERALGNPSSRRLGSARDLAGVIRVLGERKSAHRLTAVLYQPREGVVRMGEWLDDLPPTASRLLGAKAAGGGPQPTRVAELGRWEIELEGPVTGGLVVRLAVKAGDATAEGGTDSPAQEGQP